MKSTYRVLTLGIALVLPGLWTAARAQTGDCYGTVSGSGCLDTTFGSTTNAMGRVVTELNNNSQIYGIATTQVIENGLPVTKIIAATQAYPPNVNPVFALIRYNLDGSLDTGFNGTGIVITNITGYVQGIAVQNDGKILEVGAGGVILARFNPDGNLDSGFGAGGVVNLPVSKTDNSTAFAAAIQNDGKIVVAGSTTGMAAWRFNTNGTLDATFGSGGKTTVNFGGKSASSRAMTLTFQSIVVNGTPEQRIVLGGWASSGKSGGYDNFALTRLTASGQLDTSFGSAGFASRDFAGHNDVIRALAIDAQNGIIAVGYADITGTAGGSRLGVVRYNSDGSPDLTFGSNGATLLQILSGGAYGFTVALQPDGKIVAGGYASVAGADYMVLARLNSAGVLDTSFGSGGVVTTSFSAFGAVGAVGYSMALQADGKIVLGGVAELKNVVAGSTSEVGVARYIE